MKFEQLVFEPAGCCSITHMSASHKRADGITVNVADVGGATYDVALLNDAGLVARHRGQTKEQVDALLA